MTEDFDNLLAVYHFFYIAVDICKICLLRHEITSALSGDFLDNQKD